jgi:AhpD family alkylhydroperoxidase
MSHLAVRATNQCGYYIASHTVAAQEAGITHVMLAELMAVVRMADETNDCPAGIR